MWMTQIITAQIESIVAFRALSMVIVILAVQCFTCTSIGCSQYVVCVASSTISCIGGAVCYTVVDIQITHIVLECIAIRTTVTLADIIDLVREAIIYGQVA